MTVTNLDRLTEEARAFIECLPNLLPDRSIEVDGEARSAFFGQPELLIVIDGYPHSILYPDDPADQPNQIGKFVWYTVRTSKRDSRSLVANRCGRCRRDWRTKLLPNWWDFRACPDCVPREVGQWEYTTGPMTPCDLLT